MRKTAKKLLAMLLTVLMVLTILPAAVFATEQSTVASPLDSIVPYGANDQVTGTATISPQNPVTFTGYATFEDVPYYVVTVPTGTTYVKATYSNAAILTNATSGEASGYYADLPQWTGGGVEMTYTESEGDITITVPLNYTRTAADGTTVQKSFLLGTDGSGAAYAPEYDSSSNYAPVHFLAFTYAGTSAPAVVPEAITSANVTLGHAWTLDVAELFTDADGDSLTYTAAVNGLVQTLNGSMLSYTPAEAGTYTVVLTASDGSETATHTIVVTVVEAAQVPRLKNGVAATASAAVSVGYAYNLSDLQAGNIFENPDGSSLTYTDYYYYRTVDGSRSGPYYFSPALFGATTIQITENTAGTYVYEFHAMNSAGLSTDTWTLTLTVSDEIEQHYTFHVGRDMNFSSDNDRYPLIKLYKTAGLGDAGADYLATYTVNGTINYLYEDHDKAISKVDGQYVITVDGQDYVLSGYEPLTLKESDFTTDVTNSSGVLDGGYNNFYASLPSGRYSFRAYGYETTTDSANVYLGGHSLTLPTETNVDGGTGGGTDLYLRLHAIYTTSKKADNSYFTAADYTARVDMPIMGGKVQGGSAYSSGNYTYYPFMMYAAGNAALWNAYVEPTSSDYVLTQSINNTTAAGYTVVIKSLAISQAVTMTVTLPAYADFGLYFQYNNYNTKKINPATGSTTPTADAGTGDTRQLTYKVSRNNSNYTWRLEDNRPNAANYVTKAGWLQTGSADFAKTFTFHSEDSTDQYSHDFSNLGSVTRTRDEAEIQAYLDPTGYKYTTQTTERIRAYRLWQIINSDAANIMIEPEFQYKILSGGGEVKVTSGGNAKGNWLDVAPNGTTILALNYKALDVYTSSDTHGTHGGFYPATNPERTSVSVISNLENGRAKANIAYHSNGLSSSRPSAWDYNYDNWFYLNTDTAPTLDFTVTSSGATTVQCALVTTDKNTMESSLSDWINLTVDSNGKYHASLLGFRNAELAGGTVIIKMSDATGTSYSLVRVAEVTATVKNATNPQEMEIMPGDEVTLSFEGSYRGIYKYSGIFNPTTYNLFYTCGGTDYKTNVAQYQQMDQAELKLTIPSDVTFDSGSNTTDIPLTNGYTYGSMYSAANPFSTLYNMTNTGVGTNFNAVTVSFCLNRFPDVTVTVTPRYTFRVKLNVTNPTSATPTVTLKDAAGNAYSANSEGVFEDLPYGTYTYTVSCAGCNYIHDSFTLGSADKASVSDGLLTKTIALTASAAGAWDGVALTQPTLTDGVYQIGTGAELAWFANQVNGGSYSIRGALTTDIDLACYNWTPIGGNTSAKAFKGSFDGRGHTVKNLGIYYSATTTSAPYMGLFGYVNGTSSSYATIQNLKVAGKMRLISTGSLANAYSGGVVAYGNYTNLSGLVSDVDIRVTRVSGNWSNVGGIVGRMTNGTIVNCGNKGNIRAYQYAGGITGYSTGAITGCHNGGSITGNGYVGGIVGQTTQPVTACYNTGTINGTSNYVSGIAAYASGASASVKNCYNRAYVESPGSYVGAVIGMINNASAVTGSLYYLDFTCGQGIGSAKSTLQTAAAKTRAEMAASDFLGDMNAGLSTGAFGSSRYSPALTWQTDWIGLTTPTKGNVNLDPFGYVDEEDLALLQEWVAEEKTQEALTAEQWAQADMDGDGELNEADIDALIQYLANPRENPLG